MEKELLQKIYNLKKIKPDTGFVNDVRKDIALLQKKESKTYSIITFLKTPVVQNNNLVLATGLMFLIVFGVLTVPAMPSNDTTNIATPDLYPRGTIAQNGEDINDIADGGNIEVAVEETIDTRFTTAETSVRNMTKQVLGTIISERDNTVNGDVTDKEIADYIYVGLNKSIKDDNQDVGMMGIMSVPTETTETTERKDIKEAMTIYEKGNYEEFIHTIFDLLETQELLDILSE